MCNTIAAARFVSLCVPLPEPDLCFADTDCDGLDGSADAVWVAVDGSSSGDGSKTNPYAHNKTINTTHQDFGFFFFFFCCCCWLLLTGVLRLNSLAAGYTLARNNNRAVHLSAGEHSLSAPLVLADGVSIFGGFARDAATGAWSRDAATPRSRIRVCLSLISLFSFLVFV